MDSQQPPWGGHSLACDAAVDQASDPNPQTQPDVDLSCLTSDSPLGCPNHTLVPAAGRDVSAARSSKQFILLFFSVDVADIRMPKTDGSQEGCPSTYLWACTFANGVLVAVSARSPLGPSEVRDGGHYSLSPSLGSQCPAQGSQGCCSAVIEFGAWPGLLPSQAIGRQALALPNK